MPFGAAHTCMAYIREYPPGGGGFDSSQLLSLSANWFFRINGTVLGPVSSHKRGKHVFRTSEGLQSAEINTKSSFSIQEIGVKLTAA